MARKPLTDKEGEVRELTAEDFKRFRPAREVMPPEFFSEMEKLKAKRLRGRPKKSAPKKSLTVRLDADVVSWLKKAGAGYQTRLNEILRDVMKDMR